MIASIVWSNLKIPSSWGNPSLTVISWSLVLFDSWLLYLILWFRDHQWVLMLVETKSHSFDCFVLHLHWWRSWLWHFSALSAFLLLFSFLFRRFYALWAFCLVSNRKPFWSWFESAYFFYREFHGSWWICPKCLDFLELVGSSNIFMRPFVLFLERALLLFLDILVLRA